MSEHRDASDPHAPGREPRRVLIVSATMGEGHNATGRALKEAVLRVWPSAEVGWIDTLETMGPGVGPLFRWIYVTNVQKTEWLYEYFYYSLTRYRWFAVASKGFVGAWVGRRLARRVAEFAPDLVLSTYPMGTAGLAWLRRRGRLTAPIGAWISDFAPHTFWVYAPIEGNFVMHPDAVPLAQSSEPNAPVAVSAPPVRSVFRPSDHAAARERCCLPADGFVALISCGALGFGDVIDTVTELLDAHPDVVPVAVCGHNEALRRELDEIAERRPRLRVLGWTDDMPSLIAAADIVISNAGGATALEALACARPVVMHRPIAAHGHTTAELMAEAGLAELCRRSGELAATTRALVTEPHRMKAMTDRMMRHLADAGTLDDSLTMLAGSPPHGPRALRPEDALFTYIDSPSTPQQTGAVLVFDPKPDGSSATRADAAYLMSAAPGLRDRLLPATAWRRPAWLHEANRHPGDVLDERAVPGTLDDELGAVMDEFFGSGLDTDRQCAALLVTAQDGTSALLIKIRHAASDGIAVISSLVGRARGKPSLRPPSAGTSRSASPRAVARGLWSLVRAGRAPRTAFDGQADTSQRHHGMAHLDAAAVRATARALDVGTSDVTLAVLAEALSRVLGPDAPPRVRVILPLSARDTRTLRELGNHTGAAPVDLPTAPMDPVRRVAETSAAVRAQTESGAPQAAAAVVRAAGRLPPWLHRRLARLMYDGKWFNLIASVLPGARAPVNLAGATVRRVYPVMPLAPHTELAVGMITWRDEIVVCVTTTPRLAKVADQLATSTAEAFDEIRQASR